MVVLRISFLLTLAKISNISLLFIQMETLSINCSSMSAANNLCSSFLSECLEKLTLKAPITTAADDIHKYFFLCFSGKIRLEFSSESSARQRIHLKNQALFSSKDKSKKLKCRLLQFLFGALRVNQKWR